jgi:probable phosphoglycerate mutase
MLADSTEKSMRRRIYLVRHGDVDYFDAAGQPVQPATVSLNSEGRSQIEALARELAAVPLDRVVSSDLPRSMETAAILTGSRRLAIETRAAFREIQPGRLAEIPVDDLEEAFVGAFGSEITRETRFLAGESFGFLMDRVLACFQELLSDNAWRSLLIVAHGGVNRTILSHALGQGLALFGRLEQDAGCLNIIDVDQANRFLVRLINHTPYNPAKQGVHLTTMERIFQQYRPR